MNLHIESHLVLDDSRACAVDSERSEAYSPFYADSLRHVEVVSLFYGQQAVKPHRGIDS